jgi:gliding motility-associatede transport system auxiliary component
MRDWIVVAAIALGFGVLASFASDQPGWFALANFALAAASLVLGTIQVAFRARHASAPAFRRPVALGIARLLLALMAAVGLERAVAALGVQVDWTFERKYAPAPATLAALQELCQAGELDALLFADDYDPRRRSTRLLLQTLAAKSCLKFEAHRLGADPGEEDRYGVGNSNSVIVRQRAKGQPERVELVERPTEGSLFETFSLLAQRDGGLIWVARGAGEGNLESGAPTGYSGLASALATEGYALHQFVGAATNEIPDRVAAVLWIAPRRPLLPGSLDALDAYLRRGGRLVALLEPGPAGGLEDLLSRWGIEPTGGVVVDPASASIDGCVVGLCPLVYAYATSHPIARGLDETRMTFFRGARSFRLRKPEIEDQLTPVAYASLRSWIDPDLDALTRTTPPLRPASETGDYHPLLVAGRYQRGAHEVRIVAIGDADFASNHDLRALYNLDLAVNAVHWATAREPAITLRPKVAVSGSMQFPIPLQNTFTRFQSLGLLLPEALLIIAALVWARTRSA